jgi:hypothetical protein
MTRQFPYNPLLVSMSYTDSTNELRLVYRRNQKEVRYSNVPSDVAYKLFYKQEVPEIMSFYSKNIRKKFSVIR